MTWFSRVASVICRPFPPDCLGGSGEEESSPFGSRRGQPMKGECMRRTRFSLVAGLAAVSLVAAACGGGGGEGDTGAEGGQDCTWVIATMGALSGDYASIGQPIADGVEYAVNAANDEGNLQCALEFVSEDSQGDPNQAPALAQKIVQNQEVVFCACPYFSGETLATGKIFGNA